jgi:prepilin-type N-terminal cleavage/methylation domain-containing protein
MRVAKQQGFTLVELLVVMALAALTVTVALSNVVATLPHYRLLNAAHRYAADLYRTRARAILTSRTHRLLVHQLTDFGWEIQEGDQPFTPTAWYSLSDPVDLDEEYRGVLMAGPDQLRFLPNGQVVNPAGNPVVFTNTKASESITVTVTPWGEVDVSHSGG